MASWAGIGKSRTTSDWMVFFPFCFSSRRAPLGGCFFGPRLEGITLWQGCVSNAVGQEKGVQAVTLLFSICAPSYLLLVPPVKIKPFTLPVALSSPSPSLGPSELGLQLLLRNISTCGGGSILPLPSRTFQLGLSIKLL